MLELKKTKRRASIKKNLLKIKIAPLPVRLAPRGTAHKKITVRQGLSFFGQAVTIGGNGLGYLYPLAGAIAGGAALVVAKAADHYDRQEQYAQIRKMENEIRHLSNNMPEWAQLLPSSFSNSSDSLSYFENIGLETEPSGRVVIRTGLVLLFQVGSIIGQFMRVASTATEPQKAIWLAFIIFSQTIVMVANALEKHYQKDNITRVRTETSNRLQQLRDITKDNSEIQAAIPGIAVEVTKKDEKKLDSQLPDTTTSKPAKIISSRKQKLAPSTELMLSTFGSSLSSNNDTRNDAFSIIKVVSNRRSPETAVAFIPNDEKYLLTLQEAEKAITHPFSSPEYLEAEVKYQKALKQFHLFVKKKASKVKDRSQIELAEATIKMRIGNIRYLLGARNNNRALLKKTYKLLKESQETFKKHDINSANLDGLVACCVREIENISYKKPIGSQRMLKN